MRASRVDERNPPPLHTDCNLTPRLRRRSITQEQTTYPFVAGGTISGFLALQPNSMMPMARMAWSGFLERSGLFGSSRTSQGGATIPSPGVFWLRSLCGEKSKSVGRRPQLPRSLLARMGFGGVLDASRFIWIVVLIVCVRQLT